MPKTPTILATSGGFEYRPRTMLGPGPLLKLALQLSDARQRAKLCYIGTALGDQRHMNANVAEAFNDAAVDVSFCNLFPMPNHADMRAHLLAQDVIWVGGGSVAGLLAMWRLHGLDEILAEAWAAGVLLGGVSAGSICWHIGGTTDSFGPELRPVTNGLALLPYSNGVHHSAEKQRRPLFHKLVANKTLPAGYATDNGVGLVYRGTEFVEAVAEVEGRGAYYVERGADGAAIETRIEPRLLPEARSS